MRQTLRWLWFAFVLVACTGREPEQSADFDTTGILLVQVGEEVQAIPPNEAVAAAFSAAMELADEHGVDLGYPWIDPSTGALVVSVVTQHGHELIRATSIAVPYRIRDVARGTAELRRIQDDVTLLRSRGVPGAELLYQTSPDHRDNRALLVIRAMSRPLLDYLATHYPVDALAVEVNAAGANGGS